ncbi:MAG: NAD-binding protein [Gemmataceae bacterium]
MDRPIVMCGLGRMGSRVLDYLLAANLPVVIIDTVCKPDDPRLRGARLVCGDCRRREVLESAGVANARGVLILTNDDLLNVTTALTVRGLNRDVRIVLRMFNQNLLGRLGQAVHNVFALSTSLLTAPILAMTALTGQALGGYRLDDTPQGLRQLVELPVGPASPLRDQTVANVTTQRDVTVVAHFPAGGKGTFLLDVRPEAVLSAGDHVIVHGPPRELAPLLSVGERVDQELRWASWLYRMGRVGWRTLKEIDLAVSICSAVLIVVLLISTLILRHGVPQYTLAKAFLRTVSIMATAGALHEEEYREFEGITVFASTLRIVGAVLMAAFTAIVTQYLLRARLGGALEVRRVPESGHVIICGLSTVGFRVVEELARLKEPVVVIDHDAASRFVPTARRLGAAVMVGDATVIEVLRQANAGRARAVVPATNNDMTNLEVALLVRELNPTQRVVPLLNDPQFAQMLRDAAGVRLAVSVPALAAPAFLAGLFGDRVESVFFVRGRLFAVIDLVVGEDDPLAGAAVRAVAVDYRLLPVALIRNDNSPPPRPLIGGRLQAGDRLFGITALADLEPLLRRQPPARAFAVDVTAFPLPARGWLEGMARMAGGLSAADAERLAQTVPFRLARDLTRGQAEDLLAQLQRERVTATIRGIDEPAATKR